MPPRDQELPEGTDQIINGAMETGAGTGASTGSSGTGFAGTGSGGTNPGGSADFASGGGAGAAGGSSSGFIGAGAGGTSDDTAGLTGGSGAGLAGGSDFGGTATGGGSGGGFSGGSDLGGGGSGGDFGSGGGSGEFGGSGGSSGVTDQARGGVQSLKQQATDKVRTYAEDGKSRATSALDDFAQLVNETAGTIDERLGAQYGDYARRAAGTVTDFSETLRNKQVDELFDDARSLVRKSPAVAIGAAAAVGFALVRLIKSGMPDEQNDVNFQPDPQLSGGTASASSSGFSSAGSSNVDSQAPYVAPTAGV